MSAVVVLTEDEVRQLVAEAIDRYRATADNRPPAEPPLALTTDEARRMLGGISASRVAELLDPVSYSTPGRRLYSRADVLALANQTT